jgi:hypothetical protein
MNSTSLFSSVLSGIGIFLIAVGLSLLMVQPAFAIPNCNGSCKFGIIVGPFPTADDCFTVDCTQDANCKCYFDDSEAPTNFYCNCKPSGP